MGPGHRSRSPRTRSRRDQRRGGHLCQTPACCPSTSTPRRNPMASLGASALLVEEAHARPGGGGWQPLAVLVAVPLAAALLLVLAVALGEQRGPATPWAPPSPPGAPVVVAVVMEVMTLAPEE